MLNLGIFQDQGAFRQRLNEDRFEKKDEITRGGTPLQREL